LFELGGLQPWLKTFYSPDPAVLRRLAEGIAAGEAPCFAVIPEAGGSPEWRRALEAGLAGQAYRSFRVVEASEAAAGPVLLLRQGTLLPPYALLALALDWQRLSRCSAIYADRIDLDPEGRPSGAWLKTGWSPELCLAREFVSELIVLNRLWRGASEPPLAELVAAEFIGCNPARVGHVPLPLSHRLAGAPGPLDLCAATGRWCRDEGLALEGSPMNGPAAGHRRLRPLPADLPRISVIVATHEQPLLLRRCFASLRETAGGAPLELLLVDHENRSAEARAAIAEAEAGGARVMARTGSFNYAAFMNEAAAAATGELLLFLNDDTEALAPGWIAEMAGHARRPGVGAVGAKLLYADRTVQHAGVVLLGGSGAAHLGLGAAETAPGHAGRLLATGGVSAVTGAAMMVERRKFEAVGGFDAAHLPVNYNDVDLCLKLAREGWRTLVTPGATLLHHESATRRRDAREDRVRGDARERQVLLHRWRLEQAPDPFYNPNLDGRDRVGALAWPPRQTLPWPATEGGSLALAAEARGDAARSARRAEGRKAFDLALAAYRLDRLDEARAAAERALAASGPAGRDRAAILNLLGMLAERQERFADAEAALTAAVEAEPGRSEFRHNLGNYFARRRRLDDAVGCWRQVLQDNPLFVESRISLAVALEHRGQGAAALAAAADGLAQFPDHAKLLGVAARTAAGAGRPALALGWWLRLKRLGQPVSVPDLRGCARAVAAGPGFKAALADRLGIDPATVGTAPAMPAPAPSAAPTGRALAVVAALRAGDPDLALGGIAVEALEGAAAWGAPVVVACAGDADPGLVERLRRAGCQLLEGLPAGNSDAARAALLNAAVAASAADHLVVADGSWDLAADGFVADLARLSALLGTEPPPAVAVAVRPPAGLEAALVPAAGPAGIEWLAAGGSVAGPVALSAALVAELGGIAPAGGQEGFDLALRAMLAAPDVPPALVLSVPGAALSPSAEALRARRAIHSRRLGALAHGTIGGDAPGRPLRVLVDSPARGVTLAPILAPAWPQPDGWANAMAEALAAGELPFAVEILDYGTAGQRERRNGMVRVTGLATGGRAVAPDMAGLAAAARGEVLVFIDPALPPPGAEALRELAAQACRPDAGAVGPLLIRPDGTLLSAGCVLDGGCLARRALHGAAGEGGPAGGALASDAPALPMALLDPLCLAVRRDRVEAYAAVRAAGDALAGTLPPADAAGLLRLQLDMRRRGAALLLVPAARLTVGDSDGPGPSLLDQLGPDGLAGIAAAPPEELLRYADVAAGIRALPPAPARERPPVPPAEDLLRQALARAGGMLAGRGAGHAAPPGVPAAAAPPPLPGFVVQGEVDVSVVVPMYNQTAMTLACLRSLAALRTEARVEVILVDDASTEDTSALARIPALRRLRQETNQGFIRSSNTGAALARGRHLLFLNNDAEIAPDALDALLRTARDWPDAGMVGAKLVYPDGRLQEAGGLIWSDGSAWNIGRRGRADQPAFDHAREVDYCSGACLLIERSLFQELGGFDEHYLPAYGEDSDLAFKVREVGLKVVYQPLATVVHHEGASSGTDVGSGVKAHQPVNQRKLARRWGGRLRHHPDPGTPLAAALDWRMTGRVLVLDACTPTPDQDAGSVTALETMRILRDLGLGVSFAPDNMLELPGYTAALREMGVECWHAPRVASVRELLVSQGRRFDAVLVFRHHVLSRHLPDIRRLVPHAPVLLQMSDLHFLRLEREAALRRSEAKLAEAREVRAHELAMVRAADHTIVHSEVEREILAAALPGARTSRFGWVVEAPDQVPGFGERDGAVFLGGYRHPPNVDAALHLAEQVMPLLRRDGAGPRLHLAGSNPPREVLDLAAADIAVDGFVADLPAYLSRMRVMVAPLRYGAGIKGKVLSGMAAGVPCVLSSVAAEGMPIVGERDALIADGPEATAAAIRRLHGDPELWARLSAAGRALVQRHFSRTAATAELGEALRSAGLPPFRGRCTVCGAEDDFTLPAGLPVREGLVCGGCGANNRHRALARALLDHAGLEGPLSALGSGPEILDTDVFGGMHRTLRGRPFYRSSFFDPARGPLGCEAEPGVWNLDLTDMPFQDGAFDLVLTADVLEHVPDDRAAHREILRCLKPGGAHIFTVPYVPGWRDDRVRVRLEEGREVELLPRLYHGDPLREEGALVYREYGRSLMAELRAAGFEPRVRRLASRQEGIVDVTVIVARRP